MFLVEFINVGFGLSVVIRKEDNSYVVVIDCGDDKPSIYGKKSRHRVAEYLSTCEISAIDLLIITHEHDDHIGGLRELFHCCTIKECWYGCLSPVHVQLLHSNEVVTKQVVNKESLTLEPWIFTVFQPAPIGARVVTEVMEKGNKEDYANIEETLNDYSLGVLIFGISKNILITSDIPEGYWKENAKLFPKLAVLQAPHHGDLKALPAELLKSTVPEWIVVSADDEGTWELPSPNFSNHVHEYVPTTRVLNTAGVDDQLYHSGVRFMFTNGEVKQESIKIEK